MFVRVNPAAIASDAEQVGSVATKILTATTTAGSSLLACQGMAGIDPMAEEFALGTKTEGGYDLSAASMIESGVTLAKAVATFEGQVLGLASAYRAMELVGLGGGSNPYATITPTQITASPPSVGSSLGDEQRGTPQGEIMEWVENFLKDTAGIVIPTADTGKITQAASAWDAYAGELTTAKAELEAALPLTLASEFPQRGDVAAVHTKLSSLIEDLAGDAASLSEGCAAFAKSVEEIRAELLAMLGQLAAEIALDIGLGAVLSLVSFGAGAVAAAGKAALTVARWVPKLLAVINRLKTLIQSAKRTMAVMRRASIEAIESAVSGTVANATASAAFGNFSWDDVGGAAVSSAIGGAIAGPFSHIGSSITSRGARVTTRATVDGVTGGVGGVAGEFAASQVTGQDFNLLMSTLVGAAGGAAGGGLTSIKNPSASSSVSANPNASLTNTSPTPVSSGAPSATTLAGGTSSTGSNAMNTGTPNGGPPNIGVPTPGGTACGGTPTPGIGDGPEAPVGEGPGNGSSSSGGTGSGPIAGGTDVPQSNIEIPASLPHDAAAGEASTRSEVSTATSTMEVDPTGSAGLETTSIPDTNVEVPTSFENDVPQSGTGESPTTLVDADVENGGDHNTGGSEPNHPTWQFDDPQVQDLKNTLEDAVRAKNLPDYDPTGGLGWEQFMDRYFRGFDTDGRAEWNWPEYPPHKNGFKNGESTPTDLKPGDTIERITFLDEDGFPKDGRFAAPKDTPFEKLSLPPDRLTDETITVRYQVLKDLPDFIRKGIIAQGFGQPGHGVQHYFPDGLEKLTQLGYLKEIT
ncbi:TNT domain-containing protein [Leucobacter denitrificans]|uniref:TNT domain-containing protein n=1 Tax=Leucobacter denitrificans TaxID=683042 RepID=A0A7G9S260_9MICO|nr:TNT domain-containing protein [Leucobacter denitrificans]QNN61935.1 TNT domain-containing protein [Leucobacter denitrificans]